LAQTDLYSAAFAALSAELGDHERTVATERRTAGELFDELRALPRARRMLLARNLKRFQSLSLCQLLVRTSHRLGFDDVEAAAELAELATLIASRLDPGAYGAACIHDVEGQCWAQRGNVLRIRGDLAGAEEAFQVARTAIERGTGDPLELANLLSLMGSLRRFQNRVAEGTALLESALELYRSVGDSHLQGRTLIKLASFCQLDGDVASSTQALERGLALIDLDKEPMLAVTASQVLAEALIDDGRCQDAHVVLQRSWKVLDETDGFAAARVRMRWLEGCIEAGLGSLKKAERSLLLARLGFARLSLPFEFAQVSMDLALLYVRCQRNGELQHLVGEMLPLFESQELHGDAMAALLLFRQAVESQRVTRQLIDVVRARLDETQQRDNQLSLR
jgi:tetratricopeptide (TPR) repeat protein